MPLKYFRSVATVAATLVLAMVFSSCAQPDPKVSPSVAESVSAELAPFYEQEVTWKSCGGTKTYCGTIEVPADWNNPGESSFKLAVAYHQADKVKPLGSVIFNPGGPGASGYSWITDSIDQLGTDQLRANFNIVGFDPRGVGLSEPHVTCLGAKATDGLLYGDTGFELGSAQDIAATRAQTKVFSDACLENTGPGLGLLDTVSAAHDMDVIRAVFGDSQMNYLGFSYGTFLGTTYAELYPEKVGRMVLDGAINPNISESDSSLNQLVGFDQAFRNFVNDCVTSADCPFKGTSSQAVKEVKTLLKKVESNPVNTDTGRELTIWGLITGMIMPLYSEDYWPYLSQAFSELKQGDGSTFMLLADVYNDRLDNGTYASNTMEAHRAISCLDGRESADESAMAAQNKRALSASAVFGRYWQFGGLGCEQWPFPVAKRPANYDAAGSAPILVIGTTGDPATPYEEAVSLANEILENGHLVTYNGEGHTAYGRSNQCIADAVDNYFIKNVVPSEDPNC